MISRLRRLTICGALSVAPLPLLHAQEAVTLTGHVSAASMPLQGASVRIPDLNLGTSTDVDGRYSFIIPSSRVRGQTVTVVARYLRYQPGQAPIVLTGGTLVQDFELRPAGEAPVVTAAPSATPREPGESPRAVVARLPRPSVDSSTFAAAAGPLDLPSALAGRIAGLEVTSASTFGGSATMLVRGPHSIAQSTQPLVVLDGIILDQSTISTDAQRTGRGGFDYGTPVQDLNLDDIASVRLLRGPVAAALYGGRAANGVLLVSSRSGQSLQGFDISANQLYTVESPTRLPTFQNAYGQGLNGLFAFFDGKGGGVNDAVDENWGPALSGQPITQASLTEAGRADVRAFSPFPNNVSQYYQDGRTLSTNVAAQGSGESGHFRLALNNRDSRGLRPTTTLQRKSGAFTGGLQLAPRLSATLSAQVVQATGSDRPGTGLDQSNPFSSFARIGRQVDIAALGTHLRDTARKQINWIYTGAHDNPYFADLENHNTDTRTQVAVGGSVTMGLSSWLSATARGGTHGYNQQHDFSVARGWLGGYPYALGRGDFTTGGVQKEHEAVRETNVDLALRTTPWSNGGATVSFTAGAGRRQATLTTTITGSDRLTTSGAPDTLSAGRLNIDRTTDFTSSALFGGADASIGEVFSLAGRLQRESWGLGSSGNVYPSLVATWDVARASSGVRSRFEQFTVHAGWSRAGNQPSPDLIQRIATLNGGTAVLPADAENTTSGVVGASMEAAGGRLGADVSVYREQTEHALLSPAAALDSTLGRGATLSNSGIEAQVRLVPLRLDNGVEWSVLAQVAKNRNMVDALPGTATSVTLWPSIGGATLEARVGEPLGVLVGRSYLRAADGSLMLRKGLPLPDSVTGVRALGSRAPSWFGGIGSSLKLGSLDASILFDIRHGGQLFSATNRDGITSGSFAETAVRPDSGLLIEGTDAVTGSANTTHVSAQDYFHSLSLIQERWIYDASFVKLREARVSWLLPIHPPGTQRSQSLRLSVVGRNLKLWTSVPNVDPEGALSDSPVQGIEMGQLPGTRSVGVQLTLTP